MDETIVTEIADGMEIQPPYSGKTEGEIGNGSDGSPHLWTFTTPPLFEIWADHLPVEVRGFRCSKYHPTATGLTEEAAAAFVRGLLGDPRCERVRIQALPRSGYWRQIKDKESSA